MAKFTYTAKAGPRETIEGSIEAESELEAVNKLTGSGFFPLTVEKVRAGGSGILDFGKAGRRELVLFTRQLSSLISAGINVLNSLTIIYRQAANKQFKEILGQVITDVKTGNSFSEALEHHPRVFSRLYCSMARTGETSGNMKEILERLADFLEKEDEFKNAILSALIYPMFVLAVGCATVLLLLVFVIPGLVTLFEDMGQALPVPTRILIAVSGFLRNNILWLALLAGGLPFLFRYIRRFPGVQLALDRWRVTNKLTGEVALKTEISRLTRSLGLLVSSGILITQAMDTSVSIMSNSFLRNKINQLRERVREGEPLSRAAKELNIFPEFVINILAIGEETGKLDQSLTHISDDYDKEIDRRLKNLTRMLEPAIILVVGLIVGFIVMAMLLPIFEMNLLVK